MKKFHADDTIPRADYFNLSTLEFFHAPVENTTLPGEKGNTYIKVPGVFKVLLGPAAGLIFIIFLPFIGFVGLLALIGYKLGRLFQVLFHKLRKSLSYQEIH